MNLATVPDPPARDEHPQVPAKQEVQALQQHAVHQVCASQNKVRRSLQSGQHAGAGAQMRPCSGHSKESA